MLRYFERAFIKGHPEPSTRKKGVFLVGKERNFITVSTSHTIPQKRKVRWQVHQRCNSSGAVRGKKKEMEQLSPKVGRRKRKSLGGKQVVEKGDIKLNAADFLGPRGQDSLDQV